VDNPTEERVGWSFLDDIRNQFHAGTHGRHWLAWRVVEEPRLRGQFIRGEGAAGTRADAQLAIQWRSDAVEQYERKREQFQEKILVLMHMCSGQAARAPEIMSIRH
jgi:hypothetical protein